MPWPAQERVQAKSELAPSRTRRFCLPHWGTRSARNGEAAATWFGDLAALFSRFVTIVSTFLRTCTAAFATSRPSATGRPREDRDRKSPATGVPSRRKGDLRESSHFISPRHREKRRRRRATMRLARKLGVQRRRHCWRLRGHRPRPQHTT